MKRLTGAIAAVRRQELLTLGGVKKILDGVLVVLERLLVVLGFVLLRSFSHEIDGFLQTAVDNNDYFVELEMSEQNILIL